MKPHTKLGPWIKHQRKLLDLTQEDLSQRVGYALSTVRKIESGVLRPSREVAERLAHCLELEADAIPLFLKLARTPLDMAPQPGAGPAPPSLRPLPSPPALFVGRESEAAFIRLRLSQPDVRVLTLVGPPGIGKTSLALHAAPTAAASFPGGICFVGLEALTDPAQVLPAIAAALAIAEQANRPPAAAIAEALGAHPLLLVLDNAEHLLGAAPALAELLSACPALKLLVTSRAVLHLSGEQQVPVLPLACPPPGALRPPLSAHQSLGNYDAVALFVGYARLALPSFALTPENSPAVAAICARLDGLPLAIELIAARIKVLSPQQLLERLDALAARVQNKNQDRPARQQTLRGAIRWSYELLSAPEQRLFAQLGALVGGCTLEAIEAICDAGGDPVEVAELLAGLLDKSLIHCRQEPGAEPRFTMLMMVRDYAVEQLAASGGRMAAQERGARFYADLAERGDAALRGPQEAAWLRRLAAELDNLRAALGWSLEHGRLDLAHRLAGALWRFWMLRGSVSEGRAWLERTLARPFDADAPLRAKALHAAGALATLQSDYDQAVVYFNQTLALRRSLGDTAGIANTVQNLGVVSFHRTDYAQAEIFLTEALALYRELGNHLGLAAARTNLGMVMQDIGRYEEAGACYEEALAIQHKLGNRAGQANLLAMLGTVAQEQEQYAAARPLLEQSLAMHRELDLPTITTPLDSMGMVALVAGETELARQCWEECLATAQAAEQPRFVAVALEGFARLAGATGHDAEAARLWAAADAIRAALGVPKSPSIGRIHAPFQAGVRQRLGELDWRVACEEGAALDAEQAMALARRRWGAAAVVGG